MVSVNDMVVSKFDDKLTGKVTRIKAGYAYIMAEGASEPLKIKVKELVEVKRGRSAKANGKVDDIPDFLRRDGKGPEKPMTSKIQVLLSGVFEKVWKSWAKSFDTVDEAKKYLSQYILHNIKGKSAEVKSALMPGTQKPRLMAFEDVTVQANYEIETILKGIEPKYPLPVILNLTKERSIPTMPPVRPAAPPPDEKNGTPNKSVKAAKSTSAPKAASNPNAVPLKDICSQINVDPREARVVLRALSKKGKLSHDPQGRWEWPKDQVDDIKKQILAKLREEETSPVKQAKKEDKQSKKEDEKSGEVVEAKGGNKRRRLEGGKLKVVAPKKAAKKGKK